MLVTPQDNAAGVRLAHNASNTLTFTLMFTTDDAWPTTLPGTAL